MTHSAPPFQSCVSLACLAEKQAFGKPSRTGAGLCPKVVLSDGVDSQENRVSVWEAPSEEGNPSGAWDCHLCCQWLQSTGLILWEGASWSGWRGTL